MVANNIHFTKLEIRIAKYLFKHYKEKFNARQLARILNINHAHASKLCNLLTAKKLLRREELGNSVFFSYEYDHRLAAKFMEYLLSLEEKEFPKWLGVLAHSLQKFRPSIEMGLVFGSSIKTNDFNDIDILLMYDSTKSAGIRRIKEEIRESELVERPIRYIDITKEDLLLNKKDKIFYNILSESLVFCHPEKYVVMIKKCRK